MPRLWGSIFVPRPPAPPPALAEQTVVPAAAPLSASAPSRYASRPARPRAGAQHAPWPTRSMLLRHALDDLRWPSFVRLKALRPATSSALSSPRLACSRPRPTMWPWPISCSRAMLRCHLPAPLAIPPPTTNLLRLSCVATCLHDTATRSRLKDVATHRCRAPRSRPRRLS
jgi:hypothetical protein